MALGIVNAAIGFRFAVSGAWNLIYVPIVIAMVILVIIAATLKRFFAGRRKKAQPFGGPAPPAYGQGPPVPGYGQQSVPVYGQQAAPVYGEQTSGAAATANWGPQRSDIELGKMGPPPSYDTQPAKPREMI